MATGGKGTLNHFTAPPTLKYLWACFANYNILSIYYAHYVHLLATFQRKTKGFTPNKTVNINFSEKKSFCLEVTKIYFLPNVVITSFLYVHY